MATDISMRAFSAENLARCTAHHGFNHPLESWTLSDWMTATFGELGEAGNVVKKLNRERDGIPGNDKSTEELRQMLADELADTYIYLDLLALAAGIDLPGAIRAKFDRTSRKIGYTSPPLNLCECHGAPRCPGRPGAELIDGIDPADPAQNLMVDP